MNGLVNGEATNQTSIFDRGLLYGQSVFETIAVVGDKPLLWDHHLDRLMRGAARLGIPCDSNLSNLLQDDCSQLLLRGAGLDGINSVASVLRIQLTMGRGGRGYANPPDPEPTRIVTVHEYPNHDTSKWRHGIKIGVSDVRLAQQPLLAGIKHGNRLEQTLARANWTADWDEALMLDHAQNVIEATQSNVFIVADGVLKTPDLSLCGVDGVMRAYIMQVAAEIGVKAQAVRLSMGDVEDADEVFLCNSLVGIWPVRECGNILYKKREISSKLMKLLNKNEVIPNF